MQENYLSVKRKPMWGYSRLLLSGWTRLFFLKSSSEKYLCDMKIAMNPQQIAVAFAHHISVYLSVDYSMVWRALHYGCWMLQRKERMFQCIWLIGKWLEKFSNFCLNFALMKLWRSLQKGGFKKVCPLNAGLHDVSIIFGVLLEGCLFRFQDLVEEDEPPYLRLLQLKHCCCAITVCFLQEHPFPTGKLSNTLSSMVSSAHINWCWCSPLSLHHYHNLATSELISCCKSISLLSKLAPPVKSLSRPLNTKDANVFHLKA